jgi:hypothetical protein
MKKRIREFLETFIFHSGRDTVFFYGKYQGGKELSFFKKILIIFLDLSSFKNFVEYHNNPLILNTFGKSSKPKKLKLNDFEHATLETLQKDGIVFLEGYFNDQASGIAGENLKGPKEPRNKQYFINDLEQSDDFFDVLNDQSLINIASAYYGVEAYYRHRPNINFVNPARDDINSRQRVSKDQLDCFEGDEWHVDSIYNLQYHILLSDVLPGESRMLFAKGVDVGMADRFCKYASDEYVLKNFSIVDCCGPKGTVYIFDGSTHWHRFYPVKSSTRASCSVLFSRGQQVAQPGDYAKPLNTKKITPGMETHCKFII